MTCPFPGIDPYLEDQGRWQDFHARFITYACDTIAERLPERYAAQIDEQVSLVRLDEGGSQSMRPDLAIVREDRPMAEGRGKVAVAVEIEPVAVPLETSPAEEVRDAWIEIRRLPERTLVTLIELLSPTNKAGSGRDAYLEKRRALIDQPVHLVELDFLVGGRRLPMGKPLPPGDFYAIVSRLERRPIADVYAWSVRHKLPKIPIPLAAPDPDLSLDLSGVFATAYERGRYARTIDYGAALAPSLGKGDQAWAEGLGRAARG